MPRTRIEWCDYSLNPGIYGCSHVSRGCDHCYAVRAARRLVGAGIYPPGIVDEHGWTGKVIVDESKIGHAFSTLPKRKRATVFITSMGDLFHPVVPDGFRCKVWGEMASRPHLTFLVLTKRVKEMERFAAKYYRDPFPMETWSFRYNWCEPLPNVLLGASVEDQQAANEHIPALLRILAAGWFVSLEPLLGPIDLERIPLIAGYGYGWANPLQGIHPSLRTSTENRRLHWVIVGGETGPDARPMHPDWVRSIRNQCRRHAVPFFFKQWGGWVPGSQQGGGRIKYAMSLTGKVSPFTWEDMERVEPGHKKWEAVRRGQGKCRTLDGEVWDEVPWSFNEGD